VIQYLLSVSTKLSAFLGGFGAQNEKEWGWPCCGIAGAGTGGLCGLKWGPGLWAGWAEPQRAWAGVVRAVGALRAVASVLRKLFVMVHTE